ncbi:TM2 domain-containing protein DDB_G0278163-like isoform X2 [Acanthaster planci]|uniref:TM2 domain-containing protein DDB_G0278163-like isoform X2 n=1 Tax=Acanthaster planci TaxID=133434 RepID=A0A8B7ZHI3_ACAPL|nr:TM2 domain-containing protein DDB_G0278163-like isoform X2 [Acanthaster planci]
MPRHHRHHHHHHHGAAPHRGIHHHGIGHHHHHHNIHHHALVSATGQVVGGATAATRAGNSRALPICLGICGFLIFFGGMMMMALGFGVLSDFRGMGIIGCLLMFVGVVLIIAYIVFCRRYRRQVQEAFFSQLAAGGMAVQYSQPGAPPIVQPQQPGAPPIIHPQGSGATIVYGPGGQVAYQPQAQPGFQPEPQQYPATIPYPQPGPDMSKSDLPAGPTAPPPTYEDAVDPASKPDSASDTPV